MFVQVKRSQGQGVWAVEEPQRTVAMSTVMPPPDDEAVQVFVVPAHGVSGGAKPPLNGGENALLWLRPRSHPIPVFCPFAASRIRCAKLRLPLTPLRDILLKRRSKIVPGKHTPPFSGGFRPPFTHGELHHMMQLRNRDLLGN
jgi:hypothetical protein